MPSKSHLLRDNIYATLRYEIIVGTLCAGVRLHEGALAERFGVSKTPVREALARLLQADLVESLPRVGYVVKDLTVEEAQQVLFFRGVLERASGPLAARYVTESELSRLEVLAEVTLDPNDPQAIDSFFHQNREFHLTIARATRNRYLLEATERVFDQVDRILRSRLGMNHDSIERMREDHRAVVDALRSSDVEATLGALDLELEATHKAAVEAIVGRDARAEVSAFVPRHDREGGLARGATGR
jgi:DNA-binding GntR family transcriptional regulator